MAYGDAPKIAAKVLLESGQSCRKVARQLRVSPNTVKTWRDSETFETIPREISDRIKNSLLGHTYRNAYRAQSKITDEKLEAASALQLMTISAIGIDKARLMEGLSTENISHHSVIANLDSDRRKLMSILDDTGTQEGNG